ncbi:MAG: nucleotidyltransferase family protein [Pseudomonadota bacterium]
MQRFSFPIVLLAAGASRRMRGRDKLLEDVGGMPCLRAQAQKARAATWGEVIVTLPPAPHARYEAVSGLGVEVVSVPDAKEGIAASLRTAIAALPSDVPCAMVLLADLPALEIPDLCRLAEAVDLSSPIVIWRGATPSGKGGHPIVFHCSLFPKLYALQGDRGAQTLIAQHANDVLHVPFEDDRALLDLDTPEAWAAWRAQGS